MNLNFQLSDNVWWRPTFFSYTNKDFLKLIRKYIADARAFVCIEDNAEIIKDFDREYRIIYLKECLVGERNIENCSTSYVEKILVDASLISEIKEAEETIERNFTLNAERAASSSKTSAQAEKEKKKIINMYTAIQNVFPNLILPNLDILDFKVELANSIHSMVGSNLIEKPGVYRTSDAMPYGENFKYLHFDQIPIELEALFKKTRAEMQNIKIISLKQSQSLTEEETEIDIEKVIKIAAHFLNTFLYIHPYTNGNGRTARILTSYLLSGISVVPVSLTEGCSRFTYLECLRQIHSVGNIDQPPITLATLLLERVFYSLDYFNKIVII